MPTVRELWAGYTGLLPSVPVPWLAHYSMEENTVLDTTQPQTDTAPCSSPPHHWVVEQPNNAQPLPATCRKCGIARSFNPTGGAPERLTFGAYVSAMPGQGDR